MDFGLNLINRFPWVEVNLRRKRLRLLIGWKGDGWKGERPAHFGTAVHLNSKIFDRRIAYLQIHRRVESPAIEKCFVMIFGLNLRGRRNGLRDKAISIPEILDPTVSSMEWAVESVLAAG